jgi:hypothetical protein
LLSVNAGSKIGNPSWGYDEGEMIHRILVTHWRDASS